MAYTLNNLTLDTDNEGYLRNIDSWTEELATHIAQHENIDLTEKHWEIIWLLKRFYKEFEHSPAMRPLVRYIKIHLGQQYANSIYLMQLFPGSPAKISAKIAGLPRPENCL